MADGTDSPAVVGQDSCESSQDSSDPGCENALLRINIEKLMEQVASLEKKVSSMEETITSLKEQNKKVVVDRNKYQTAYQKVKAELSRLAVPGGALAVVKTVNVSQPRMDTSDAEESEAEVMSVCRPPSQVGSETGSNDEAEGFQSPKQKKRKRVVVKSPEAFPPLPQAAGSVYNIGLSVGPTGPYHNVVHFAKKSSDESMFDKAKIVSSIPARWPLHPSYMHSFGITDNYFIIVEQPLSISLPGLLSTKIKNEPLAASLRWYNNEYNHINIVSRVTGKRQYNFFTETFFYLHIINQFEDSDYIIIDVCAYRDPSMIDCMYYETMKDMHNNPDYAKMFRGRPIRFVLPLKPLNHDTAANTNLVNYKNSKATACYLDNGIILAKAEKLCDIGCETPRINYENFLGKKYRYFYAISSDVDAVNPGTLIKVDIANNSCKIWHENNCYPSEPIFVSSPNAKAEDEGVILSVLVWGQEDTNHVGLLILNAHTFEEIARAEFITPSPVPKCLHGWYLPETYA